MEFIESYKKMFQNYFVFEGRTSRKDFWQAILVNFVVALVISCIGGLIETGILSTIYAIILFIPGIAMGIRRLHDTNRSGWCMLLCLIPLVGAIILIVFYAEAAVNEGNMYGTVETEGTVVNEPEVNTEVNNPVEEMHVEETPVEEPHVEETPTEVEPEVQPEEPKEE